MRNQHLRHPGARVTRSCCRRGGSACTGDAADGRAACVSFHGSAAKEVRPRTMEQSWCLAIRVPFFVRNLTVTYQPASSTAPTASPALASRSDTNRPCETSILSTCETAGTKLRGPAGFGRVHTSKRTGTALKPKQIEVDKHANTYKP